jgi:hypothetical protein
VIRLEWDGAGMRSYRVLGDDALADIGTWPELWSTSTAASGPLRFRDAPPAGRRFYRLTVERLP